MDYSKMSDFEINKRVGITTGDATAIEPCFEVVVRNKTGREFNPCNSPADAWPIIVENNISLILDNPSSAMATSNCVGWYSDEDAPIHASNLNPLRAAMIVFLKMQDSANVPANSTGSDIR